MFLLSAPSIHIFVWTNFKRNNEFYSEIWRILFTIIRTIPIIEQ